jgi:hypothetical protein
MAEDLVDHRRIFNPCPEPDEGEALVFKAPMALHFSVLRRSCIS